MKAIITRSHNIERTLLESLEHINWKNLISENDNVIIKPNFGTHNIKNGFTTNLELINYIIPLIRTRTDNVYVGETNSMGKNFKKLLHNAKLDCELINLSNCETYSLKINKNTINLPQIVLESKIINMPILKTHILTKVTAGIKNLFGLIQDADKSKFHYDIDNILKNIYLKLKPPINILDAIYSMDGKGPGGGNVHQTNFFIVSDDALVLDIVVAELMGLHPLDLSYVKSITGEQIPPYEIICDDIDSFRLKFQIPKSGRLVKIGMSMQRNKFGRIFLSAFPTSKLL